MIKNLSRRKFLQRSAGAAVAMSAAKSVFLGDSRLEAAGYLEVPPSDRVRFGIIGIGMQVPICSEIPFSCRESNALLRVTFMTADIAWPRKSSVPASRQQDATRNF